MVPRLAKSLHLGIRPSGEPVLSNTAVVPLSSVSPGDPKLSARSRFFGSRLARGGEGAGLPRGGSAPRWPAGRGSTLVTAYFLTGRSFWRRFRFSAAVASPCWAAIRNHFSASSRFFFTDFPEA